MVIRKEITLAAVVCVAVCICPLASGNDFTDWFVANLEGEKVPQSVSGKALSAAQAEAEKERLWAAYKAAAIKLGWDQELAENIGFPTLPSREEMAKLTPEERPKLPKLDAAMMPAGEENMPYFLFSRGERPESGWPLYFQTHGGGSTDEKLAGPHAWPVNTRDWQAQVNVCLFALPEGMYFVPRMANDNKGRWWMKHNHIAFDKIIRRTILFREVDPNRIYMMGISEGAYGTEAMTPFWADRFAGGCAMAGGAGGGERFYNLRNTAFRSDTGENDTMFNRVGLARQAHDFIARLKKDDPTGYDHSLNIQAGRGHGIDYRPGPAWIATKNRDTSPAKISWFNHVLHGERRTDFSWLSLAKVPENDTLITAEIHRDPNRIEITAKINPPGTEPERTVYNTSTPEPVADRINYTGNILTVHLNDSLLNLDEVLTVMVNGEEKFSGMVVRDVWHIAEDISNHGDPGRIFPGRIHIEL